MQAERSREQSWRIHVTAKAKSFNFAFRATTFSPTWTFCRFFIVLKLRKFVFRIDSEPTESIAEPTKAGGFMRTKFVKLVQKFRARFTKNRPIAAKTKRASNLLYPKGPIRIGFLVMGFVAFLAPSISKKDQKGIMVLASVGFFIASLLKKFKTGRLLNISAAILVVATIVCYLFLGFDNICWDYMGRYAWNRIANL